MAEYKKDASATQNAKLRRMTDHYGDANASMKRYADVTADKANGPMKAVGYGAEGDTPKPRGDRAGRRPAAANPVPTYAAGGAVSPLGMLGGSTGERKSSKKTQTPNINIIINASKKDDAPPPIGLGSMAPPGGGAPPMPPPGAGPGGPPPGSMAPPGGMPPGAVPPGLMPGRKRGGAVHPDEAQDKALIKKTLRSEGLIPERARGGRLKLDAGAGSGPGRLEKSNFEGRISKRKQTV